MAGLAELLIEGTQKEIANAPQQMQVGANIAKSIIQIGQQRKQIEQKKQQLDDADIKEFMGSYAKLPSFKTPAGKKGFLKMLKSRRDQSPLLQKAFPDENLEFYQGSPGMEMFPSFIAGDVQDGALTAGEALAIYGDPEKAHDYAVEKGFGSIEDAGNSFIANQEGAKLILDTGAKRQAAAFQMKKFDATEEHRTVVRDEKKELEQRNVIRKDKLFLSKEFVDKGISDTAVALMDVDKLIPGGIANYDNSDLPGFGKGEGRTSTANLKSPKARKLRQSVLAVSNGILKMRSGGAVTNPEANRLLNELGIQQTFIDALSEGAVFKAGTLLFAAGEKTDKDLINGLRSVKSKLAGKMGALRGGVSAEGLAAFQKDAGPKTVDLNSEFFRANDEEAAPQQEGPPAAQFDFVAPEQMAQFKAQFKAAAKKPTMIQVVNGLRKEFPNAKLTELNRLAEELMRGK